MTFTKCPHCSGKLVESPDYVRYFEPLYLYDCAQCHRGFNVFPDGHWEALYDAGHTNYTKEDVEEAQK